MTTILEITSGTEVAISLLDDEGIVISAVPIVTLTGAEMSSKYHARTHAEEAGWQTYGEWNENDEFAWIQVVPKPLTLAFAGTEIPDESAVQYAKNAGFEVESVVKQTYVPEDGKTYIAFSVNSPRNWDWGYNPFSTVVE
jgi:hypothetical protein